MSKKEHTGLSGKQKFALIALCLITGWQVLQNDKITNALAALFFGGVIPGTNKVLPPETMMYIAGGVGVLVAILVTIHFVRRAHRYDQAGNHNDERREPVQNIASTTPDFIEVPSEPQIFAQPIIEPQQSPEKVSESAVKAARPHITFAPLLTRISKAMHILSVFVVQHGGSFGIALRKGVKQAVKFSHIGLVHAMKGIKISAQYTVLAIRTICAYSVKVSVTAWRWAEPHFRNFDKWLELRVRDIEKWGRKKAHKHEDAQLLFDVSRKSVKLLNQFAAKSVQKMSIVQKPRNEDFSED